MFDTENIKSDCELAISDPNAQRDMPDPFLHSFGKISKQSWQMSASFTFGIQMGVLVYLLSQINDDEEHLAAITLITSLINAIVCIGISPTFAMSLVAGKELGELRDAEKQGEETEEQLQLRRAHISAVFGNGLLISLVVSPPMIAAMVFSKPLLINVFNQNENVAEIAQQFIRPYALALPPLMVRMCAEQVMFTFERTKPSMLMSCSNFAFSMSLGSVLAFGKLGSPKLGATGILIGCILDAYLTGAAYSFYLAKSPRLKQFNFWDLYKPWRPYLNQLTEIRTLGRSLLICMTIEITMNLMTGAFAGVVGVQEQAAFSAIMQFSLFSLLIQIAFGQTCAQEMSRQIGESHFAHASQTGKVGMVAMLASITPVLLFLSAYPAILTDMMGTKNQAIEDILKNLAPIMFVGCALDAARFLLLQELRVLGDANTSTLISSGCIALGIVLSGVLGLKTDMGVYGVATGFTSSAGLAATILLTLWIKRIQPLAIEENKKNPKPEFSIKNSCVAFFKPKPPPQGSESDIQMSVPNPLQLV